MRPFRLLLRRTSGTRAAGPSLLWGRVCPSAALNTAGFSGDVSAGGFLMHGPVPAGQSRAFGAASNAASQTWRCQECSELNTSDCASCMLCGASAPAEVHRRQPLQEELEGDSTAASPNRLSSPSDERLSLLDDDAADDPEPTLPSSAEHDGANDSVARASVAADVSDPASSAHAVPSLDSLSDMEAAFDDVPRAPAAAASAEDDRAGDPSAESADVTTSHDRWGVPPSAGAASKPRSPLVAGRDARGHTKVSLRRDVSKRRSKAAAEGIHQSRGWDASEKEHREPQEQRAPARAIVQPAASAPATAADATPQQPHAPSGGASTPLTEEELAKPSDFTDGQGRRWTRWVCDTCQVINNHPFGNIGRCRKCRGFFGGVRPWVCLSCGDKNVRQRKECSSCAQPRRTGVICRRCGTPHSIYDRACPKCQAWGHSRLGKQERLIGRTFACPSCGTTIDAESNNAPKISSFCDGDAHACHGCGATFKYSEHVRRTDELPLIGSRGTPAGRAAADGTRGAGDEGRRLFPAPRHGGRSRFTSAPITERSADVANPTATATAVSVDAVASPAATAAQAASDGPWECTLCGQNNDATADTCSQCFDRRPVAPASGGVGVAKAAAETAPGSWRCRLCRTLQPTTNQLCVSCGKGKCPVQVAAPSGGTVRGDWKCPSCFFVNFASRAACRRCSTKRPAGEGDAAAGSGTASGAASASAKQPAQSSWRCVICKHANVRRTSTLCAVCGTDALHIRAAKGSPKVHTFSSLSSSDAEGIVRKAAEDGIATNVDAATPTSGTAAGEVAASDLWTCPVCSHSNPATAETCTLCDGDRPTDEPPATVKDASENAAVVREASHACPFCSAPQPAAASGLPVITEGGDAVQHSASGCTQCGRHAIEASCGVWFCGNPKCDERSSSELNAPDIRSDGAILLPSLGTWNSATRIVCARCNTPRDSKHMPLLQFLTRCGGCKHNLPGSSVTAACPHCGQSPVMRLGDYACGVCKAENFANRHYCRSCHRLRNPRYVFVDTDGRRVRNAGSADDDAWALHTLSEPATTNILAAESGASAADSSSDFDGSDSSGTDGGGGESARAAVTDSPPSSGGEWTCRLCGETNAVAEAACGGCGIDKPV